MDARFICEYRPTVKIRAEQIRKDQSILSYAALVIWFLVYLRDVLSYEFHWFPWTMLLLTFAGLIFAPVSPEIHARSEIKRMKKRLGEDPVDTISFGDSIEIIRGTGRVCWEYSDVKRVKQLKHSFILERDKNLTIVLDPNGFTKGTFADFKEFLRVRCPNVEIPD